MLLSLIEKKHQAFSYKMLDALIITSRSVVWYWLFLSPKPICDIIEGTSFILHIHPLIRSGLSQWS